MAQLRAAGLVTLTEEGSLTYYSLRRDRLDEVGVDLRRFITTSPSPDGIGRGLRAAASIRPAC